ncbi:MAG TPA: glycerol-3-phosphate dehydrogenase [Legionella sp.]|nr:glycerol-3-phosphate dehydrogenase [Legionella sp.]
MSFDRVFDVVIIGGGINGAGCAADAALRGLSVLLCEQDDLASKTSSSSSKLIHGGLRYLETFDFKLVKKALNERQTLSRIAPHLIHPLPIFIPHQSSMRPAWFVRIGLFIYDHLSRINTLPHSRLFRRSQKTPYFTPLSATVSEGFLFYDCKTDDARLTLVNALQAKQHGATIMTQTALIKAEAMDTRWHLTLQTSSGQVVQVQAKSVINAAGPWVSKVNQLLHLPDIHSLTHVKGSHLVVHKLYEGEHAYLLQHDDQRIVFVVPYHDQTMIGTTEVPFEGELDDISMEPSEIDYLLALIHRYFNKRLFPSDIITTWSGVRPLISEEGKQNTALSREYACHFSNKPAPAISIYGGKITTYRQLAAEAIDQLSLIFKALPLSSTATRPLPGATLGTMTFAEYQRYACEKYHWLDGMTRNRYLSLYGTRTEAILAGCENTHHMGICFTDTLYQVEVDYLMQDEWACCVDDILWRRTKLGLTMEASHQKILSDYMNSHQVR